MIVFRPAEARDLADIMRLIHEAQAFMRGLGIDQWQDGYPGEEQLLRDIEIGQMFVYADGDAIAAVAALSLLPEPIYEDLDGHWLQGGAYLTVHRMALDDAHRGAGLAGQMLDEAVRRARANGCASVRVDTHRGNRAMRRFLEKNGFAFCGLVRYEVRGGDPLRAAYEKLI